MKCGNILIAGPNSLQNELIASFLQEEISANCCVAADTYAAFGSHRPEEREQGLLLYDCSGDDVDACMEHCAPLLQKDPGRKEKSSASYQKVPQEKKLRRICA